MHIARLAPLLAAVTTAAVLAPLAAAEIPPAVTGVEVTSDAGADATYALGETVEVTVTFSEAVEVTGAPWLAIDMDPASLGREACGVCARARARRLWCSRTRWWSRTIRRGASRCSGARCR